MRYFILLIFMSLCACSGRIPMQEKVRGWMQENGKIKILCTTAYVAALAEAVGSDDVDVLGLIPSQNDPHSYQMVKGDAEKFERADVIFYSGLGLEHNTSLLRRLNSSGAYPLAEEIVKQSDRLITLETIPDPHLWMDLSIWSQGAQIIARHLTDRYPHLKNHFFNRAKKTEESLLNVHKQILQMIQAIPEQKRYLVTIHDGFNYFCRAYLASEQEQQNGFWKQRYIAPEGLAPDSQISTQDLNTTISYILQHQVTMLFPEFGVNQDSLRKIVNVCRKKGFQPIISSLPLYGDTMPAPGIEGYIAMMRCNAKTFSQIQKESL